MKTRTLVFLILCLLGFHVLLDAQTPFSRGVNLTGWFQTSNVRQVQFTKYTKKDFQNIKSLGCDAIRLPINLFSMTSGSPGYTIDPLFYEFLDQAVGWAEELELYLILDNHSSDDLASKNPDLQPLLVNVWTQMAQHYKNRSKYVMYEVLNEPNGTLTTQAWGAIQQQAINAIRSVDASHYIIVGAAGFNTYSEMAQLPYYSDSKLIYTFHFYDPFIFTHQGATWVTPSMAPLANVPFPYNAVTMPAVPASLTGSWVASAMNNYKNDGTLAKVKSLIDQAYNFKIARNVNVFCGEFGVYIPNSKDADRVYWYSEVRKYLEAKGIAWTIWDYQGGFGLFKKGSNELFDYDVNLPLVAALGLTQPAQKTYTMKPDSVGFAVYTDFIGEKITEASNPNGGTVDFYSIEKPNNGTKCLLWKDCNQYGSIGFNFLPDKDLSKLRTQNYAVSFLVKGNTAGTKFDLRFVDSKTGASDHPWRMNYTVSDNNAAWDGKWHKMYVPLTLFTEGGSWDSGSWYNPAGAFDWKAVDRFEIVAEHASLAGKSVWFDNIQLVNADTAKVYDTSSGTIALPFQTSKLTISPNPVKQSATIYYSVAQSAPVTISMYTLTGQMVETLTSGTILIGNHTMKWNRSDSSSQLMPGIYICKLQTGNETVSEKLILL